MNENALLIAIFLNVIKKNLEYIWTVDVNCIYAAAMRFSVGGKFSQSRIRTLI